jgi:hypothetical protein
MLLFCLIMFGQEIIVIGANMCEEWLGERACRSLFYGTSGVVKRVRFFVSFPMLCSLRLALDRLDRLDRQNDTNPTRTSPSRHFTGT